MHADVVSDRGRWDEPPRPWVTVTSRPERIIS